MKYSIQPNCRICCCPDFWEVFKIGNDIALSGVFPLPGEEVISGPLTVVMCKRCGLSQLRENYPLHLMYGPHYGYRSGLNESMRQHLKGLSTFVPLDTKSILDIGSNDGTFLSLDRFQYIRRVGIDPLAKNLAHLYSPGVELIDDFFPTNKLGSETFDVITTFAMFYDLPDPVTTARRIWDRLNPGGRWLLEVGDLLRSLENKAFDTICHEHLEYYRIGDIQRIASMAGFEDIYSATTDVNGGSLFVVLERTTKPTPVIHVEHTLWRQMWEALNRDVLALKRKSLDFLSFHPEARGLGASTKGNILLQYFGITREMLPCIAEINPTKFGHVTPGTNIPIIDEKDVNPKEWFVLPWHFKDNILERYGERPCFFPLPEGELCERKL